MQPESALTALGFTELESRLYCELLRESPLTGYRLAQIVAKAPANTYQALKTLAQKGGVLISDRAGEAKTYRPVPPAELMASLEHGFSLRKESALEAFEGMLAAPKGEHVYQLQTVSQVIERAHSMFSNAKEIVLFDFFPPIFEMMEPSIRAAQARGVIVAGIAYEAEHSEETIPHNVEAGPVISELWPGLGLIVVADGEQQLIAQISKDKTTLLNAIWSESLFLSSTYHSALAAEIRLTAIRLDPSDPLRFISLFRARPPGLRRVLGSQPKD